MTLHLYIADDIQSLQDGKTLMVGVYTDRVVLVNVPRGFVHDPDAPLASSKLCFLVNVSDLVPGAHTVSLTIEGPSGQRRKQIGDERRFEIQPKSSANFVAALSPFAIKKFGICNLIVVLDGNTHHLPFEL